MKHIITVSGCDDSTTVPIELTEQELDGVTKLIVMVNAADNSACTPSIWFGGYGSLEEIEVEYNEKVQEAKETKK